MFRTGIAARRGRIEHRSRYGRKLLAERLEDRSLLAVVFSHDFDDPVQAIVPDEEQYDSIGLDWTGANEPFDDAAWTVTGATGGVGYDRGNVYDPLIGLDVEGSMFGSATTFFARAEFVVLGAATVEFMELGIRYDDGFIAWLNGVEIARANVTGAYPQWNAVAESSHQASPASYEAFDLSSVLGLLRNGTNVLAIRGLNASVDDEDALVQVSLVGERYEGPPVAVPDNVATNESQSVTIDVLANDERGEDPIDPATVRIVSHPNFATAKVNPDGTITLTPIQGYQGTASFSYRVLDDSTSEFASTTLVASDAFVRRIIPTSDVYGTAWRGGDDSFNASSSWAANRFGIGYDTNPQGVDFTPYISSTVNADFMQRTSASIYMRSGFQVFDPTEFATLTLRMRYDDGFAAFINGVRVASAFAPEELSYNSQATTVGGNGDTNAIEFQDFDITPYLGVLRTGSNTFAIHGLNGQMNSSDLLFQPELVAKTPLRGRASNVATVQVTVTPVQYPPVARDDAYEVAENATFNTSATASVGTPWTLPLIESGSVWSYREGSIAPYSDIYGNRWTEQAYDESQWSSGPAQLGYGDGDEATVLSCGPNPACNGGNNITTWFRKHFWLEPGIARKTESLLVELLRDDGAVVYINGREVARSNMPAGGIGAQTLALTGIVDEDTYFPTTVSGSLISNLLRDGDNVVAVEVHQVNDTSSDVSFDLRLSASVGNSGTVLWNDTDLNIQVITAVLESGPQHGTITLRTDGSFRYTPNLNFVGVDSFTYRARDGANNSEPATVTLTVRHTAPTVVSDSYTMLEDGVLVVDAPGGVLANDSDSQGHPISAILVQPPQRGTLSFAADGSFRYTPEPDFAGSVSFRYRATDGELESFDTSASIRVTAVNDAPVAENDIYSILPGETLRTVSGEPQSYFDAVMSSELYAYWRLGEGVGSPAALDETGKFPGLYLGGGTRGHAGALLGDSNTSADFNGTTGIVQIPQQTGLGFPGASSNFGIMAWIKPDTVSGLQVIVEQITQTTGYSLAIMDGRIRLTLPTLVYETEPVLVVGGWHHIAVVPDSDIDGFYFYLDGESLGKINGVFEPEILRNVAAPVTIGGGTAAFDGRIDEVVLFADLSMSFADLVRLTNRSLLQPFHYVWPAALGGTGHVYEFTSLGSATWQYHRDFAQRQTYFGVRGDLTTVTSAAELNFLMAATSNSRGWLGAYQDRSTADYAEPAGGWKWVTGEPWAYENWAADNPDNASGADDFLYLNHLSGVWVDHAADATPNGLWIEYPTNVVQPPIAEAIARGATWKYRDNIQNGSAYPVDAQGDRWNESDYDDATWLSGPGILGYDVIDGGPIATTLNFGGNSNNKYRTYLFRREFHVDDADRVISLALDLLVDDGAAIYINGREIFRRNLPGSVGDNTLTTNTFAPGAIPETHLPYIVDLGDFQHLLVDGTNTIAVEVHQVNANSSDLGFDLAMTMTAGPELLPGGVLVGDIDADGDLLFATLLSGPEHGTLEFYSDGSFDYTPNAGFIGTDRFTYRLSDGQLLSEPATVMIVVASTNQPAADLNADGRVDVGDVAFLMASYGKATGATSFEGDLNGDGRIGVRDLIVVRNSFSPPLAAAAVVAQAIDRIVTDAPRGEATARSVRAGRNAGESRRISRAASDFVFDEENDVTVDVSDAVEVRARRVQRSAARR
jgi:hypothetical protein